MSRRLPTVARTIIYFHYKPFLRCRLDVRLWHALLFTFQYKPFMWCRPDAQLRLVNLFVHLSRRRFRHPIGFQLLLLGFWEDYRLISSYLSCSANLLFDCAYWPAHVQHVCICYILCPNCLASTFIVLTWLVDLARCWRRRSYGWRVR